MKKDQQPTDKEQEIRYLLEKIAASERIQRLEQISIDSAKERLHILRATTTKEAFRELNNKD